MTLYHKNNTRNGLPSQNHMNMRYYTCSWLHLLKKTFDLEISGGHFVFALKKFRPRVPMWHPDDFCSGHPIASESIIKHRPYRETRFSQNPLDYSGCVRGNTPLQSMGRVLPPGGGLLLEGGVSDDDTPH